VANGRSLLPPFGGKSAKKNEKKNKMNALSGEFSLKMHQTLLEINFWRKYCKK